MSAQELFFTVLGPSGAGKTTLLSCMYKQFERVLPGAFFPAGAGTFAALNTAWKQMVSSAEDLSSDFSVSIQGTEDLREYSFTLKGQSEDSNITFYDFPGGWMNPYDESQSENFMRVTEIVRKSSAIIVAVNTPYLMEEGGRYRDKAAVDEIEYILRTSFSDNAQAKLIAIVPIKCEKYTRTAEGLSALNEKISQEFASTIGLMKNPAYSGKLSVEIIPVQTVGNANFSEFTFQDNQIAGEVYSKIPGMLFSPKDADKLLMRISSHLAESLRPPITTIPGHDSPPEYTPPFTPRTITRKTSRIRWSLSAALCVVFAVGMYIYSYMYYHDKDINAGNIAKVESLSREVESLRKKIADDESKHKRESIHLKAQSARDVEGLNAKIKAVEAERDKALANLNEALKSEASALEAKSEAEKIKRDYSRLLEAEVKRAVDAVKVSADKEIAKLKNEIESLRKAEAERKRQADKEKEESPDGLFQRGVLLYIDNNYKEAFELFTKSAQKGNADAENMLCVMYYRGEGVTENKARAKEFERRAAIHGSAAGQYNYGGSLRGEEKYAEAKVFYEMSAEQNYTYSMNALGYLYFYGNGIEQDYKAAFDWYMKSAEMGDSEGQFSVAYMYEHGIGAPIDMANARKWYEKSAGQGHEDAQKWISEHEMKGEISRDYFRKLCDSSASNMRSELLRLRISPNFRFSEGDKPTLLMVAAGYTKSPEIIRTLISMGADVNAVDNDSWTALIWVLRLNNGINKTAIVRTLLENGAKVKLNGKSALDSTTDYNLKNLLRRYQ